MINMCFAILISRVQISWPFVPRIIIHDWDKCLSGSESPLNVSRKTCHFALTHTWIRLA